jgi:hypothetical protein
MEQLVLERASLDRQIADLALERESMSQALQSLQLQQN